MSCSQAYNVGDEVEVTFRGTVNSAKNSVVNKGQRLIIGTDAGPTHAVYPSEMTYSVRLVKPAVEEGCVYVDADGVLFYRLREGDKIYGNTDPWRGVTNSLSWNEGSVRRPLTKLVPER